MCFSHMDVLAKLFILATYACMFKVEGTQQNLSVDVDTYIGVTLSELLDNIA